MSHDEHDSRNDDDDALTPYYSRRDALKLGAATAASSIILPTLSDVANAAGKRSPQVPRRVLGKTKRKIPILLVGTAFRLDKVFDPKLAEAYRYGVNYLDTADCYAGGTSEGAVAAFHTRAKLRSRLFITSKSDEHTPEAFAKRLGESLKKLKTSYVDLYYLHALKDISVLNDDLRKVVAKLKKQGKMKAFGFSCHDGNVVALMRKAATLPWIDSIMFRYNFRQYGKKDLDRAIDACHKAGIGLIAMKTQASAVSFESKWARFRKKGKWTQHQAVLKAVWEDKRITAAVSHMDTFQKLRQNIAAALDKTKLTMLEHEELQRYAEATRHLACDGCGHFCEPHVDPEIQIADTLRYLMYHDSYRDAGEARRRFAALHEKARQISGIDFEKATAACPNGLDIASLMHRASKVLKG